MDMSLPASSPSPPRQSFSSDGEIEGDQLDSSGVSQDRSPMVSRDKDSDGPPSAKRLKSDPDASTSSESEDPLAKLLESPDSDSKPKSSPTKSRPPHNLPKLNVDQAAALSEQSPGSSTTPLLDTPTTPHPGGAAAQERNKMEQMKEEREKMQLLVSSFTEDQLDRYAMYRRAALPKATIKKIMQTITGSSVGHNVVIAMAGIAKVFAGEVVEEALNKMAEIGEGGQPVRPKQLREAVRKMRAKGTYMPKHKKQCPFK
eukprot:GFUD01024530.1.p1 GENE.GFUD01024530.1~~GFUD01024530.1.p1  ORF type:complete len:258 (-),score=102.36 GFUD01024530.1:146-919(-)